jgi:hypothetical protein
MIYKTYDVATLIIFPSYFHHISIIFPCASLYIYLPKCPEMAWRNGVHKFGTMPTFSLSRHAAKSIGFEYRRRKGNNEHA